LRGGISTKKKSEKTITPALGGKGMLKGGSHRPVSNARLNPNWGVQRRKKKKKYKQGKCRKMKDTERHQSGKQLRGELGKETRNHNRRQKGKTGEFQPGAPIKRRKRRKHGRGSYRPAHYGPGRVVGV